MASLLPKISAPSTFPPQMPSRSTLQKLLFTTSSAATKLDYPALAVDALQEKPPSLHEKPSVLQQRSPNGSNGSGGNKDDFYLNLGVAVRTLREDLPALFSKDLNYDIYREDIAFIDPLNTFQGIKNYKLIFWALRLHGRILFRDIRVKIFRIWQPSENVILIRWELQGVPRVPWEARGSFQGTSWYKLDRNGKIYEHKVDNLALNFPRMEVGPRTVIDLVAAACPPSPNLTFWGGALDYNQQLSGSCAWVELYWAVRGTLEKEALSTAGLGLEALFTCS